ncbi:unnamed protein product [Linum tenue]|uniref:Uncharacterized protein n=1 Tax=Linum tenue TaxID=586396 RepID=A0AAV0QYQ1_9ROSI|nr:unnamed protein product [Linum tenue]
MGSAVETLCGQAYGAQKYAMLGIYLQQSILILLLTAAAISVVYIFSKPILISLGQSPEIASAASLFVYGLIPELFACAVNFPVQKFLQAQSIVAPTAYISATVLYGLTIGLKLFVISLLINRRMNVWIQKLYICSVRVSNELGAGNPKSAAFSVIVSASLSCFISVVIAIALLAVRDVVSYAFTGGEEVAAAVSDLCPLLALALIINGIQPVLSGVAVGCGWQEFVAYVNVGCYYAVGIPVGVILGFYYDLGAKGIWSGMIGGTALQTIILIWVTVRTDWIKEVPISFCEY